MARYYVSKNAIRDLNVDKRTPLLDKDGNEVDAYIIIDIDHPCIYNVFGCSEYLDLAYLRLSEDKLAGKIITGGLLSQYINFYILDKEPEYKTEW